MISALILQNVTICLFKYFVSHITVIPRNDTFLYHGINQVFSSLFSIMRYPGQTWDNFYEICFCLRFYQRQFEALTLFTSNNYWKSSFFTFAKVQEPEKTQVPEKLW